MICGSGGSKSRLAKAAGAEPCGQMRDEKLHAVVARSTFPSQNAQSTPCSDSLLEVEMSKKCTPLWREARFQVKSAKKPTGTEHFWTFRCRSAWPAPGIVHIVRSEKTCGFSSISKNDGRRGTLEEDLERCIFRGRRGTRDMFIRYVRRSGR